MEEKKSLILEEFVENLSDEILNFYRCERRELKNILKNEVERFAKKIIEELSQEIENAVKYYEIQDSLNKSSFRNERIEGLKIAKKLINMYFFEKIKENE